MVRNSIIATMLVSAALRACNKTTTRTFAPVAPKDSSIIITGYLPTYRIGAIDSSNYGYVNRINYFSMIPSATGTFVYASSDSANLVSIQGILKPKQQLFVTLGGSAAGANIA